MNPLKRILDSTVGQKALVAITGLALVGFLITHLAGNLLMYSGDDGAAFNAYSAGLHDLGVLLYVAEIGLLIIFLTHVALVARLVIKQRASGGAGRYAVKATKRAAVPESEPPEGESEAGEGEASDATQGDTNSASNVTPISSKWEDKAG